MAGRPESTGRLLLVILVAVGGLLSMGSRYALASEDGATKPGAAPSGGGAEEGWIEVVINEGEDAPEVWELVHSFQVQPTPENTAGVFGILDEVLANWDSHPPDVVESILEGIAKHRVEEGYGYLVRFFHVEPTLPVAQFVPCSAARALGDFGGSRSLEELMNAEKWAPDRLLASVALALGVLADPRAVPTLESLAQRADPEVRERALSALARFCSPSSKPLVLRNASDTEGSVRNSVAWWLAQCGEAEDGSRLASLLDDRELLVRANALKGLIRLRQRDGCPKIAELIADESLTVQLLARDYEAVCKAP